MTHGEKGVIAILGASGTVGAAAVVWLRRLGIGPLRLGSRRPREGFVRVDATEPDSLAAFCQGTRVVLNCAGPSYRLLDRVARAAWAVGADYADVAGDGPAHRLLTACDPETERVAVLSAGVLPGLSGLIPRWLAARTAGRPFGLVAHCGGLERCSTAAAADLLLSLPSAGGTSEHGESLAAWRAGIRRPGVSRAGTLTLEPFGGKVYRQPFLTAEADRLAAALGLSEMDWYNVYPGDRVHAVLASAIGADLADPEVFETITARLRTAAEIDLAGRTPCYRLAFRLSTSDEQREVMVELADSYHATGWLGAQAARAVLAGQVKPGVHFAAEVLDPDVIVAALSDSGLVTDPEDGTL